MLYKNAILFKNLNEVSICDDAEQDWCPEMLSRLSNNHFTMVQKHESWFKKNKMHKNSL